MEVLCKYKDLKWNPNILGKKFSVKLQSFYKKAVFRDRPKTFCQSNNLKSVEKKGRMGLLKNMYGMRFVNIWTGDAIWYKM